MKALDPIFTKVLWNRLISIVDEAATGLVRTAYSMVVRDFHDYCVALFDVSGNLLVHSTRSTPGFIGIMPGVMRGFLAQHPAATLADGDVLITNDPWLATSHLLDISVATPIFYAGGLVGFAVCVVHHLDIGGRMACIESRDMYEEGLKIPVLKLYEAGRRNDAIFAFVDANVRSAGKVKGDLRSQLVANEVCALGVRKMIAEYGFADLEALSGTIVRLAEQSLRARIGALPDGVYRNAVELPAVGALKTAIRLQLALEIRGDGIVLDYAGSSPEVEAAVNVTLSMTTSYSCFPIKVALDPFVPNNEGCLLPIAVRAPAGSILNCRPPAPTWGRSIISHCLPELIFGALVDALPDRTIAACGSTPLTLLTFRGKRAGGADFLSVTTHIGGFGAGLETDGYASLPFPNNTAAIPVEVTENETPLIYLKKEMAVDSAGPGRRRGGPGEEIVLAVPDDHRAPPSPVTTSVRGWARGPESGFPVFGRKAGGVGRGSGLDLNGRPQHTNQLFQLAPGDVLRLQTPGGGGFGAPFEREPALVRQDVRAGLVSVAGARSDYGVVLGGADHEVDEAATEAARSRPAAAD